MPTDAGLLFTPIAIGKLTIVENNLDSATYSQLDLVVDYEFTPHTGDSRKYFVEIIFYDMQGRYEGPIQNTLLEKTKGRAEIRVDSWRMPRNRPGTETYLYKVELMYLRVDRDQQEQFDEIFGTPFLPVKATYE